MPKKISVIAIVLVIVAMLLLLIYFESLPVPLDKVSLTLEDLDDVYEEFDKEHIKEPYIAPTGTLFAGWNILEKYHVRFSNNNSSFIVIDIGRLISKDKCKELISKIKNTTFFGYDFTELESETIGEELYIGENITTITNDFRPKVIIYYYFIVFRIEKVVVAFVSSGITKETSINYAKIMENTILSN